jgi:hypothetical protein
VPADGFLDENRVVHDSDGNVLADFSHETCPAALAGAATNDLRGPFDELSLTYLDESVAPMWTGLGTSFNVPAHKPAGMSDQAMFWSARLAAATRPESQFDYDQLLEVGVSYGRWPGVIGLDNLSYWAWARFVADANFTYYSTPVRVQDGAHVRIVMHLIGVRQNVPDYPIPIFDPASYLSWALDLYVDGAKVPTFIAATNSLGRVTWSGALPGVVAIWNMPGTGASTCGEVMPPDGWVVFSGILEATAPATAPTAMTWASAPLVRFGTVPGTPGLNCSPWGTDNVVVSSPTTVMLSWPTQTPVAQPPPPPPPPRPVLVPAVTPHVLAALALALACIGAGSIQRRRRS